MLIDYLPKGTFSFLFNLYIVIKDIWNFIIDQGIVWNKLAEMAEFDFLKLLRKLFLKLINSLAVAWKYICILLDKVLLNTVIIRKFSIIGLHTILDLVIHSMYSL